MVLIKLVPRCVYFYFVTCINLEIIYLNIYLILHCVCALKEIISHTY